MTRRLGTSTLPANSKDGGGGASDATSARKLEFLASSSHWGAAIVTNPRQVSRFAQPPAGADMQGQGVAPLWNDTATASRPSAGGGTLIMPGVQLSARSVPNATVAGWRS